jgi:hypothetical protein
MTSLAAFERAPPDWASADARHDVVAKAKAHAGQLERCNELAPASIRLNPEFRRLIDGALASLGLVPQAVETHDGALLHRLLIELQSLDRLLSFRFG